MFPQIILIILGRDLAEWIERLAVNLKVVTVLGLDPSILRHSGIWWAEDEAVLINVRKNEGKKISVNGR